jgi:hypothetical protein
MVYRTIKTVSQIFLALCFCFWSSVSNDSFLSNYNDYEFQFLYDGEYHVKPVFAEALVISCFTAIFVDLEHGCKHRIFYRYLVKKG